LIHLGRILDHTHAPYAIHNIVNQQKPINKNMQEQKRMAHENVPMMVFTEMEQTSKQKAYALPFD